MKWRTDKPTADKILAILKNGIWVVLNHRKIGQSYSGISYDEEYADEYGNEYATGFIEKWADLEEDETVTNCHQLEDAAEGTIDSVSYEGIGDRTLIAVAMTHEELRKLGEYHIDSVVHIRKVN